MYGMCTDYRISRRTGKIRIEYGWHGIVVALDRDAHAEEHVTNSLCAHEIIIAIHGRIEFCGAR